MGREWLRHFDRLDVFAIAGCRVKVPLLDAMVGAIAGCWVPLLDAGCHCWVPCGGVPLLDAIDGCQ